MTDTFHGDPPSPPLELLTIEEAARRYPIGSKRLRQLVRDNQIRHIRLTGPQRSHVKLRPQVIEDYLLSLEQGPAPSPAAR